MSRTDKQPQQVPGGPALLCGAAVGGAVRPEGGAECPGRSAEPPDGRRQGGTQQPDHPDQLLSALRGRLRRAAAPQNQVLPSGTQPCTLKTGAPNQAHPRHTAMYTKDGGSKSGTPMTHTHVWKQKHLRGISNELFEQ